MDAPHSIELQPSSTSTRLQQSKNTEKEKLREEKSNALFAGIDTSKKRESDSSDDEKKKKKKKKDKAKKEEEKQEELLTLDKTQTS